MKRRTILAALTLLVAPAAWAGSPHFTKVDVTRSGDTLTASGTEAGLGDETQVDIVLSGTALCINGGGAHPKAENKTGFAEQGQFPVQNGHADFSLSATPTFQPSCDPPMTVEFTDVQVCDVDHDVCYSVSGTL